LKKCGGTHEKQGAAGYKKDLSPGQRAKGPVRARRRFCGIGRAAMVLAGRRPVFCARGRFLAGPPSGAFAMGGAAAGLFLRAAFIPAW